MEVRTLARCLLRSRPASSLLYAQQQPGLAARRLQPINNHVRGQFLSVPSIRYNSSAAAAAASAQSEASQPAAPATTSEQQSSSQQESSSLSTPTTPETQPETQKKPDVNETIDQILDRLNVGGRGAPQPTTTTTLQSARERIEAARRRLADPLSLSRAVGESAETDNYRTSTRRVELKLGPRLGRQVNVDPDRGIDVAAALRSLQVQCANNRVRAQANAQRFHVRRGQMRKNIRMERWRKLFKYSFNATVAKIQRMRAQGW